MRFCVLFPCVAIIFQAYVTFGHHYVMAREAAPCGVPFSSRNPTLTEISEYVDALLSATNTQLVMRKTQFYGSRRLGMYFESFADSGALRRRQLHVVLSTKYLIRILGLS